MRRVRILLSSVFLLGGFMSNAQAAQNSPGVTFYKDALPVFQQKCQTCHRTGQVAPFSLETYETARPWAKAVKEAILSRKMPPAQGFSGAHFSKQIAEMTLTSSETNTIVSWVDGGALKGNPQDAPSPRIFNRDGWTLRPDIVIESPVEYEIPAVGVVPWVDYLLPYKFDSANNKYNPDPTAPVVMGQQNWEEMWNSIVTVAVPNDVDPKQIAIKAEATKTPQ